MAFLQADNHWLSARSSRSTLRQGPEERVDVNDDGANPFMPEERLFACPYLKHDPEEYSERQSCSRSGWKTVQGLRQHVYRGHILPIKCPGCSQPFNSSRAFTHHLAEAQDCELALSGDDEPVQGLDKLIQKIKTPAVSAADPTEEDMWRVLYKTLFPKDAKHYIPSPYLENHQGSLNIISRCPSTISLPLAPRNPEPAHFRSSSLRISHGTDDGATTSGAPTRSGSPTISVTTDGMDERRDRTARSSGAPTSRFEEVMTYSDGASETQTRSNVTSSYQEKSSDRKRLKKEMRKKTMEAQVLEFRAWEKPHRTDEHISPGKYRSFWIWIARCFTFYIPSWFLIKVLKMDDLRQRLAFRQKVLFCVLLFAIYGVVTYFLVIQPILSCVIKVPIGMIPKDNAFCDVVRNIIYVYMAVGGGFMVLVAICVCLVRYKSRKFDEHEKLLVMQIPCYNEDEFTLRKTIESCVASSYKKDRKLLFIVADGLVAAAGEKPTYQILLEDIFDHKEDLELGVDTLAHEYMSYAETGQLPNKAHTACGFYRGVPYVVVIKTGRDDEQMNAKPGNRGKRDSQLLAYNFFHYVNYRRFWNPFFENLEFRMRTSLNIDARDAMYMLAIDCDTAVDKTGISYLIHQLEKTPKLLGVCGYTGVSNGMDSFVANSQVFEYWLTHAVLKAVESICSSVFVLSGCFTIYRLKWENNRPAILHPLLLEDYAGSYDKTLHEHNLLSIGEDRYLSTLAIRYFGSDCRLRYFSAATCTTVVPTTLSVLMDQRRRWTNSLIHCHFAHLNVMPFEASWWTHTKMLFVLGCELFMVFILPLALPAGVALAVISLLLVPYAWAMLLAFVLLPVFLCILCMDWTYIPFYLPFFPMIGMFSIVIPIYSLWNQDNIKWGKTRGG